ncbi:hypothetical protein ABS71_16525 [bacterium SCN 62-11]|nr:MAG: hypothetical protein ABS71_16525 [bacterium SCN 62-11]
MPVFRRLFRVATVLLLVAQAGFAAPLLFSVQTRFQVAENLPYGPTAVTPGVAGLDTSLGNVVHNSWTSIGSDSNGLLYNIEWQFSSTKTLEQRFIDAVTVGEAVTWTVTSPLITGSQVMSGTWFFSHTAGDMAARFAGSGDGLFLGSGFSADDGFWGAGDGTLDATREFGDTIASNARWGFGNNASYDSDYFQNSSSGQVLVLNGVFNAGPSLPAGFQNQVFVNSLQVPELNPVSASLPLMFAFLSLALSGSRRKRA